MDTPPAFDSIFARLECVRQTRDGWEALCPAHDDHRPSLTLSLAGDKLLVWCRRRCDFAAIVGALGVKPGAFFTGDKLAPKWRTVATYDYCDEDGKRLYQKLRQESEDSGGRIKKFAGRHWRDGEWAWNLNGVRRVLYRLPELLASKGRTVFVVEGEKCVERLRNLDLIATTNDEGAGKWRHEFSTLYLAGRRCVVLADNDQPGIDHAVQVAGSLMVGGAVGVRYLRLEGPPKFDVADFLDAGGTRENLLRLVELTCEWRPCK